MRLLHLCFVECEIMASFCLLEKCHIEVPSKFLCAVMLDKVSLPLCVFSSSGILSGVR